LRQADDAIAIDSTGLTIDQVIALMEKSYRDIVAGKGKQL
jgi:cytidylate kinase